jgi:predicted NBD/HSP70 family sugar kinase
VVRNDVFALAYGQHWFGVASELSDFAVVAAGSGIGYALCLNGRVLEIAKNDVVEIEHRILDPSGPMRPVGHRGCVASYLTTGAILSAAAYGLRRPVLLDELSHRAGEGDPVCRNIAREAGRALGIPRSHHRQSHRCADRDGRRRDD